MNITTAPEGKVCDYIGQKLRKDTPEEYVRQTIEKRLIDELKYRMLRLRLNLHSK